MLNLIAERLRQRNRTVAFPHKEPVLPDRFRGRPVIAAHACPDRDDPCGRCLGVCPTGALNLTVAGPELDMARCIFCGECERVCPQGVIRFSRDYRLGASRREDLVIRPGQDGAPLIAPLGSSLGRMFKRSLRLRQISAAGCNACEADCNVLTTIVFDLGRFGIDFVASPRHADAILVTGPVTRNMQAALVTCFEAVPAPKLVIATGACALSGGLFRGLSANGNGLSPLMGADLFIPGCPPHPYTTLDALLRLLGRV